MIKFQFPLCYSNPDELIAFALGVADELPLGNIEKHREKS